MTQNPGSYKAKKLSKGGCVNLEGGLEMEFCCLCHMLIAPNRGGRKEVNFSFQVLPKDYPTGSENEKLQNSPSENHSSIELCQINFFMKN